MTLPNEPSETPYAIGAFRIHHTHVPEDTDPYFPGTVVVELTGSLPGTDAEATVAFEFGMDDAFDLMELLVYNLRRVADEGRLCADEAFEDGPGLDPA